MPTILDLFNSNRSDLYQGQNIGGGEKESQTNKNEGEIRKEFKDRQSPFRNRELYGLQGTAIIESRGLINPARIAALAVSSPSPVADLIGSQLNGFLGGNANKPDDTIFKNKKVFSKPITLLATTQALQRDAVKEGEMYYIKSSPFPGNILKNFVSAFKNPAAFVSMGAMALNKFGSKGAIKRLGELLKRKGDAPGYGPKFGQVDDPIKSITEKYVKYSTHYTLFIPKKALERSSATTGKDIYSRTSNEKADVKVRQFTKMSDGNSQWDLINDTVLSNAGKAQFNDNKSVEEILKEIFAGAANKLPGYVYVVIRSYGKTGADSASNSVVLPGAISGISEDFAPEINSSKSIGSPFPLYRYGGVERTLKFELKVYALDPKHELYLRSNINKLRKLVYPDEDLSVVSYGDAAYSPMYFTPNMVQLTVYGLYSDLLCIVDTLSISIDDNTPWATNDFIFGDTSQDIPHPTVFNVSLGFRIINNPAIKKENNKAKYQFGSSDVENKKYEDYFTGYAPSINGDIKKDDLKTLLPGEQDRKEAEIAKKVEKPRGKTKN